MEIFKSVVEVYNQNDDGPNGNLFLLLDTVYDSKYYWSETDGVTLEMIRDNARDSLAAMEAAGLYEKLDELARVQTARGPRRTGSWIASPPELSTVGNMTRACNARMFLAHERGDSDEFLRALGHSLTFARILGIQGEMIDGLRAYGIEAGTLDQLRTILIGHSFDESTLHEISVVLDRHLMQGLGELLFETERLWLLDFVQAISTEDGRLLATEAASYTRPGTNVPLMMPSVAEYLLSNLATVVLPRKADAEKKINDYFDGLVIHMNTPFAERTNETFDPEAFLGELPITYSFIKVLFIPPNAGNIWNQGMLMRDGTKLMLAIETHQARHGVYPASLKDIDPTILEEPPRDPYGTGPLVYRPLAPREDKHNRPYLIYSVGRDMTDNGGKSHEDGPYGAIRKGGPPGYDYVLNHVNEEYE